MKNFQYQIKKLLEERGVTIDRTTSTEDGRVIWRWKLNNTTGIWQDHEDTAILGAVKWLLKL